jgi:acyl-CoA reductase-like NAD-dependent aldehyde dehydrogenase
MSTSQVSRATKSSQIYLGGSWVDPSDPDVVTVHSPVTEEVVGEFPQLSKEDAGQAVQLARDAFDDGRWSGLSIEERIPYVERYLEALERRSDEIADVWISEVGVTRPIADAFNSMAVLLGKDGVGVAREMTVRERRTTAAGNVELRRQPVGTVLAIHTYNGPAVLFSTTVIPALLMGNTVIAKQPQETGLTAQVMAEVVDEAGFPEGVLSVVSAATETSKYLVEHPGIDMVHFTGGTDVGAEIASTCGKRLSQVILELGGKSAAIVTDDVDLDEIMPTLVGGMIPIQGQVCVALTRVLVARSRHDELVGHLKKALGALRIGDPDDPAVDFGPLPNERVWDRTRGYIDRAVAEGAEVAFGGQRPPGFDRGWFMEPTLLTNVDNSMEVAQNEVFGPLFVVIPFDDVDDAIEIANDSRYGLAGAVFCQDDETAWRIAGKVDVGAMAINGNFPCLSAPFGGVKDSGFGRVGGPDGMYEFTNIKQIVLPPEAVVS